jgi:hypothetical protein
MAADASAPAVLMPAQFINAEPERIGSDATDWISPCAAIERSSCLGHCHANERQQGDCKNDNFLHEENLLIKITTSKPLFFLDP